MKLSTLRRVYQVFFLALFIFLIAVTDFKNLKGFPVKFFHDIDPLISITSFFSSGVIYKTLILSLIIIFITIVFGRVFCSWICPMGILHHIVSAFPKGKTKTEMMESNKYRTLYEFKYFVLIAFVVLSLFTSMQIGLLDPIAFTSRAFSIYVWPMFSAMGAPLYLKGPAFEGAALIGALFVLVLALNIWITRFYCRAICPLGALLGMISVYSLFRIKRDTQTCNDCELCLLHCQGGCDPHDKHMAHECHGCMNCIDDCPQDSMSYGLAVGKIPQKGFDISKRKLIGSAIAGAAFFSFFRTSVSSATTVNEKMIRPPGSLPEIDFLKKCIKCAECMRVCPTSVIHPTLLEAGIEGIWSPYLIMRIGYCEYNCNLCGIVCPTGAIREISVAEKIGEKPYKNPIVIGTAFFDRGRCLPWAMDVECIVCEEVCPTSPKAIWFRTKEVTDRKGKKKLLKMPYLSPELCIGCGICETKCPVSDKAAIRVTSVGESRSKENVILLKK